MDGRRTIRVRFSRWSAALLAAAVLVATTVVPDARADDPTAPAKVTFHLIQLPKDSADKITEGRTLATVPAAEWALKKLLALVAEKKAREAQLSPLRVVLGTRGYSREYFIGPGIPDPGAEAEVFSTCYGSLTISYDVKHGRGRYLGNIELPRGATWYLGSSDNDDKKEFAFMQVE
jgi:hypothetical protein